MVNAIRIATAAIGAANIAQQQCPASPACPANNGCTYSTNGATFQVECSIDLYGSDMEIVQPVFHSPISQADAILKPTQVTTYAGCMDACSTTQGCEAVSYTNNFCYLKNGIPPPVQK